MGFNEMMKALDVNTAGGTKTLQPTTHTIDGTQDLQNGTRSPQPDLTNGCIIEPLNHDESFVLLGTKQARFLSKLLSISAEAKIWGVASRALSMPSPPILYPEYSRPGGTGYVYRQLDFWTSGFFPGCLYLVLERRTKYPHLFSNNNRPHAAQLEYACKWWTENLHQNASVQATHDLGFMLMPWARPAWEISGDKRAFDTMCLAADSLLGRFDTVVGCIRSWDTCTTQIYDFKDPRKDFLMIIDNMMNLSLLFYISEKTGNTKMRDAAIQHARTTALSHVREDGSTTHLVVFEPTTGGIKAKLTNQGYSHTSCWARGQAWAIAGFSEAYLWTEKTEFLDTARRCADYFLENLPATFIAPWDFDAAVASKLKDQPQPPDTSASMIAAYGMLLLHRALRAKGEQSRFLNAACRIAEAVCERHLTSPAKYVMETTEVETVEDGTSNHLSGLTVDIGGADTIVNGATINNFEFAPRRWADHGLVYADYFFLLFGNEILKTDIGGLLDHST